MFLKDISSLADVVYCLSFHRTLQGHQIFSVLRISFASCWLCFWPAPANGLCLQSWVTPWYRIAPGASGGRGRAMPATPRFQFCVSFSCVLLVLLCVVLCVVVVAVLQLFVLLFVKHLPLHVRLAIASVLFVARCLLSVVRCPLCPLPALHILCHVFGSLAKI